MTGRPIVAVVCPERGDWVSGETIRMPRAQGAPHLEEHALNRLTRIAPCKRLGHAPTIPSRPVRATRRAPGGGHTTRSPPRPPPAEHRERRRARRWRHVLVGEFDGSPPATTARCVGAEREPARAGRERRDRALPEEHVEEPDHDRPLTRSDSSRTPRSTRRAEPPRTRAPTRRSRRRRRPPARARSRSRGPARTARSSSAPRRRPLGSDDREARQRGRGEVQDRAVVALLAERARAEHERQERRRARDQELLQSDARGASASAVPSAA